MKEFFGHSIDMKRLPRHIAIIMDGNGRWAEKRALPRVFGHEKGFDALKNLITFNREVGVPFISAYAFSTENWNRPASEIEFLMNLAKKVIREYTQLLLDNDVRLLISGNREELDQELQDLIHEAEQRTSHCQSYVFNTAFNYGSRREILQAVQRLALDTAEGRILPQDLTEQSLEKYFYQPALPDVDLLIRTSGEKRISNFLLWQNAYSEFYFTDTYWPDFDSREFILAIKDYQNRNRRFGSI